MSAEAEASATPAATPLGGGVGLEDFMGFSDDTPQLGLGLAALGRPGYINLGRAADIAEAGERSVDVMRQRAHEVLDAAYAAGVRYFDCARSYGMSEEFLAEWLESRNFSKEDVVVGSKWGYRYTADWRVDTDGEPHEVKDHSLSHLTSQLAETLDLLGSHLRLYQIHSATMESGVLENADVLSALRELREQHGVRLGLSLSGVQQGATLKLAMECNLFDSVQATWNVLEQSAGEALLEAAESGMQVIIKEAMANGRVLQSERVQQAASDFGVAPDALALAVVMAQPFRPMVLSGAVTQEQVVSNWDAVRLAERLQTEEGAAVMAELLADAVMDPSAYWQQRSQMSWN